MILMLSARFRRHIAILFFGIFYVQLTLGERIIHWYGKANAAQFTFPGFTTSKNISVKDAPGFPFNKAEQRKWSDENKKTGRRSAFIGGPTQPESQSFHPVNSNNMVDLFSGDFSYNIPLLDVGGYPVNIAYHSGITMDEEASWTGLGWNINPGSITRNMRGVPDDFNGGADTVRKVSNIKPNKTVGVSIGANVELAGAPLDVKAGLSFGLFHTTYNGWGLERALDASINAAAKSLPELTGGLSLTVTNNSQTGMTVNPSLSANWRITNAKNAGDATYGFQTSAPYNTMSGLKSIQMSLTAKAYKKNESTTSDANAGYSSSFGSLTFEWPTYNPTMTMPLTNYNFSFTAKLGGLAKIFHPNIYLRGYTSKEYIAPADTALALPVFGYLNFQNMDNNWASLTDYNREKEMAYREKPAIPHIGVPAYTYDIFTVSGEGTGGSFRPYRGDIGFIADHLTTSKTSSGAASIDFGAGDISHGGVDLNANYSMTQSGPWLSGNLLRKNIAFRKSNGLFEGSYFRNPGEKAINTAAFYAALGDDDVVTPELYQPGNSGPFISTTGNLMRFRAKNLVGTIPVNSSSAVRNTRDKRSQVISYLTAGEASTVGLSKYIEHYAINQFGLHDCQNDAPQDAAGEGTGLLGYYFNSQTYQGTVTTRLDPTVYFNWDINSPFWNDRVHVDQSYPRDNFSVRWAGRVKAPVSGDYAIGTYTDDGIRVWINDSLVINNPTLHGVTWDSCHLKLLAGHLYDIRMEYFENKGYAVSYLAWKKPGDAPHPFVQDKDTLQTKYLYPPKFTDTFQVNPILTRESRVNNFRKSNHISEIDVLNPDGRRYVYGIPVYNLQQREVSFSVNSGRGNLQTGLTAYNHGVDNSTMNANGKDGFYSREDIPAYAHSFLLTGILSSDYVDVTGDGISDDDIGDAIKFNYSKAAGVASPFEWRAPYVTDSANYNEGFRTYNRDDKAHYISGKKELWYLHSIESKTMIATFTLQPRRDLLEIDERGVKTNNGKGFLLEKIDLYSKADFMQRGTLARPIKTVHFDYSYELCRGVNYPVNDSGKLTLKRIWFTYNGNEKGKLNPYVFNYHSTNPRYRTNANDKWGTYKDIYQNPGSTASRPVSNAEYPYSLQDSLLAAQNAGAWMLDSILLPSGGRIKVKYESDDYAYVQNKRAAQLFSIAGFGSDSSGRYNNLLYLPQSDQLYVYVNIPYTVSSPQELFARYLEGLGKLYFRLNVAMPGDQFGSGTEYVPCYADPDVSAGKWYGVTNTDPHVMWIKLKGVDKTGQAGGSLSPLAETAINFLRLNLPSQAYPGSEGNEDPGLIEGIRVLASQANNIMNLIFGFDKTARMSFLAVSADLSRSFIRLDCPTLKKYGGGHRVKSVLIYDNWNAMTGRKETVYGQTYDYTTTRTVNGVPTIVSSGVASWEPMAGGDENPLHVPIEYLERTSMLGPAATLYTEAPLGEAFYPAASVGYSNVRVHSTHTNKTRSANGYSETSFYTTYDFPTYSDWSAIDNSTKKRYKPLLANFLRINAKNYLTLSQGFKVELNDMNGKLRREATYAEADSAHPISYTENFYRVDNISSESKHLSNIASAIDPDGNIDTTAIIGKDIELMADMRDQTSTSIGGNVQVNADMFSIGALPAVIPSLINLYQQETIQFRSAAMTKVIHRYGILDSIVHMEKGSKITSSNLLYDGETGEPLLVKTANEFNDPVYNFTYPAHWMYKAAGPAYRNIGALLDHLTISGGRITAGLPQPDSTYLTAGDELLVFSKQTISATNCVNSYASFRDSYKLWVVDSNTINGGPKWLFLADQYGTPFNGNDVTLKVIRSGRRNMNMAVGSVTSLLNPLVKDATGRYRLVFDSTTKVIAAAASELRQYWKVADKRKSDILTSCIDTQTDNARIAGQSCSCLRPFFDYLISSNRLLISKAMRVTVGALVTEANKANYNINLSQCTVLSDNANLPFYAQYAGNNSIIYAHIGNTLVTLESISGLPMQISNMRASYCDTLGRVIYKDPSIVVPKADTVTVNMIPDFSVTLLSSNDYCPNYTDTLLAVDSISDRLLVENNLNIGYIRNAISMLRFDKLGQIPSYAQILSAQIILQADRRGHYPPMWPNANSLNPVDTTAYAVTAPAGWFPNQQLDTVLQQAYRSPWFTGVKNRAAFQNDTVDVRAYLSGYRNGLYASNTFLLTQGSDNLQSGKWAIDTVAGYPRAVPRYLLSGYGNYYSTFYSQRYADSTKWPAMRVTYVIPPPMVDTLGVIVQYNSSSSCTTVYGRNCYSSVIDTLVNPYQYGILGNYRPLRNYVYYGSRKESDLAGNRVTDIRKDGTIRGFAPFWTLQPGGWQPAFDSTRWVWNSETTLFNRKGFELENKDPLGRYNAGLYGYGLTLPTAVLQNSHYQEAAYEGFEDYGYVANSCDTFCRESRPFDFTAYASNISNLQAHTGIYSLRIPRDSTLSITAPIQTGADVGDLQLASAVENSTCNMQEIKGIQASAATILPSFAPVAGKKLLIGAWVKEEASCACQQYSRDHILVSFAGAVSTTVVLSPSGNMVEGWQRYEAFVDVPVSAASVTITLQASDSSTTFFDDIRIHPFQAEMKSYVYHPITLRLMAELDENNYATFYEYDDDGTLIRVKKETERGIQTIKETRSALLKYQ